MDNNITTILSNKNKVFCPSCTEEQDDFAEDYILSGVGHDSKCESVCWNCNNIHFHSGKIE